MVIKTYIFEVECIESGQRRAYGDSFYSYKVTSDLLEKKVKLFCMNILKRSYKEENMPNWASGKLLEFKKVTNNNEKGSILKREKETYLYKVKKEYTG